MFQYMDYIYKVYQCGSFSKAAKELYMTQPALSIAIKKAEEEMGTVLFERGKTPICLTESGRYYIKTVEKIYKMKEELQDVFLDMKQLQRGKITIGAANIVTTYFMPDILKVFSRKYPEIEVQIKEESLYVLKNMLKKEELDLILDTEWYEDDISVCRLFQNYVLLAIPKELIQDHKLLYKGMTARQVKNNEFLKKEAQKITMDDVIKIPFLSLQPRNEIHLRSQIIFDYYKKIPKVKMSFNQQNTAYRFAAHGFGAAFVSDSLIKCAPEEEGLLYYQFDCPMPERWVSIGYKKRKYLSNASKAFIKTAEEILKSSYV